MASGVEVVMHGSSCLPHREGQVVVSHVTLPLWEIWRIGTENGPADLGPPRGFIRTVVQPDEIPLANRAVNANRFLGDVRGQRAVGPIDVCVGPTCTMVANSTEGSTSALVRPTGLNAEPAGMNIVMDPRSSAKNSVEMTPPTGPLAGTRCAASVAYSSAIAPWKPRRKFCEVDEIRDGRD